MVPTWPYGEEDRTNWAVQEKRATTDTEYRQDWTSVRNQTTKMSRIKNKWGFFLRFADRASQYIYLSN